MFRIGQDSDNNKDERFWNVGSIVFVDLSDRSHSGAQQLPGKESQGRRPSIGADG